MGPLSCLSLAPLSPLSRLSIAWSRLSLSPLSSMSGLHLACISPTSRLHLACISPASRLHLADALGDAPPGKCGPLRCSAVSRPYLGRISAVSRAPGGPPPPLCHLGALHR